MSFIWDSHNANASALENSQIKALGILSLMNAFVVFLIATMLRIKNRLNKAPSPTQGDGNSRNNAIPLFSETKKHHK